MISFQETNKNYFYQVFVVGMRNLSDNQKLDRYNNFKIGNISIKNEIRLRLKEYYTKECKENDKGVFYCEIFNLIGFYEFDYILNNLLCESNFINIINFLFLNSCFEKLDINDVRYSTNKTFENIKLILDSKKVYRLYDLEKHLFSSLNTIINNTEYSKKIKNDNSLIREYPKWLIDNLSSENSILSFKYFSYIWHLLDFKNNNTQVILLYHYFIEQIKLKSPNGLEDFVNKTKFIFESNFAVTKHLPFIENVNQIGLNSGIQNKISELDTLISKSAKIKLLSSSDNLIELVNILNNNSDPEINKIVLNNILFKINSLRSITVQDLKTILDLNSSYENNIIKQSVFKKFYFFEFYDYEFSKSSYKIESNESKKIMQNDYLPLRLLPASLEFNIGINTLINHLVSKGFNVENLKHNSKLTIEMYESLQAKFSNDKISKSNKNIIQLKRYSDMELIYFKSIIKKKIKQANLDYEILSNILRDSNLVIKYSAIAKKYNIYFDKINIQKIEIKKAIEKLTSSIQNLYYLVSKIENKTFGVCIKTGKLIDKKRLIENLFVTTIE